MRPWKKPKSDLLIFEAALTWFPCYHFISYIILYIYNTKKSWFDQNLLLCVHWVSTLQTRSLHGDRTANYTDFFGPFSFIFLGVTSAYITMYIYIYVHIHTDDTSMYIMYIYISILIQISLSIFPSYFCWSWHLGQVVEADVPDDEPGITKVADKGTSFNTGI